MKFEIVPQDESWVKQAKKNLTAFYENRPMERMPFEFYHFDITDEFKPKTEATSGRREKYRGSAPGVS